MSQVIKIRRTLTPDTPPTALADGELAAGLADVPIRMWIGTPSGVQELFVGTAVQDAPSDAVYGRSNGEWQPVPFVLPTVPANPAPNSLWFNTTNGMLYFYYDDGDSKQWVSISGQVGPQGPQGAQGIPGPDGFAFPDVPVDGAYLRRNGEWIRMIHATAVGPGTNQGTPAGGWSNTPSLNVGSEGTWFVSGTVTWFNASGASFWQARLWDGITTIAQHTSTTSAVNLYACISLSGVITNPQGQLQAGANGSLAGTMPANQTRITAVRIG